MPYPVERLLEVHEDVVEVLLALEVLLACIYYINDYEDLTLLLFLLTFVYMCCVDKNDLCIMFFQ